jgi:hypothetical protein
MWKGRESDQLQAIQTARSIRDRRSDIYAQAQTADSRLQTLGSSPARVAVGHPLDDLAILLLHSMAVSHTTFATFTVPDHNLLLGKVNILNSQSQTFN